MIATSENKHLSNDLAEKVATLNEREVAIDEMDATIQRKETAIKLMDVALIEKDSLIEQKDTALELQRLQHENLANVARMQTEQLQ